MESTLNRLGNTRLTDIYKSWRETLSRREDEMINNIHHYCASNSFHRGIFLVGAAHRRYIIEKLEKRPPTEQKNIRWNFYPSHQPGISDS